MCSWMCSVRLFSCWPWFCHSARHRTCSWQPISLWTLKAQKWCVPPKPPASSVAFLLPLFSIISQAALSRFSLLSFSWAPEAGLWPMDECYILAVSTGVSWGLACGGSAVSGSVCQLLIPLPTRPSEQAAVGDTNTRWAATESDLWLGGGGRGMKG